MMRQLSYVHHTLPIHYALVAGSVVTTARFAGNCNEMSASANRPPMGPYVPMTDALSLSV